MFDQLRGASKFVGDKIGWNRIGLALSVAIIATAAVVLYRTLHNLNFAELMVALKTFDKRDIAIAAGFVALGYVTLTFYDLFALRTIGRDHVPYRIAALAGFTSYAIGHNVGASVFTGGAVRYRIYSHHGSVGCGCCQGLFRRRADVLARQCNRAGSRNSLRAAGREFDQSTADGGEPGHRRRHSARARCRTWSGSGAHHARSATRAGKSRCRAVR